MEEKRAYVITGVEGVTWYMSDIFCMVKNIPWRAPKMTGPPFLTV